VGNEGAAGEVEEGTELRTGIIQAACEVVEIISVPFQSFEDGVLSPIAVPTGAAGRLAHRWHAYTLIGSKRR